MTRSTSKIPLNVVLFSFIILLSAARSHAQDGGFLDAGTASPPQADAEPQNEPSTEAEKEERKPNAGFRVVGSLFSRYELRRGYDAHMLGAPARLYANQDAIYYRARMGLQTTPLAIDENLTASVRFVPQSSGVWHVGGDGLEDASLNLHEGFVRLTLPALNFDIGRFEMSYGDEFVIGAVGWHQTGRSFDGMRLKVAPSSWKIWLDVFATWIDEGFVRNVGSDWMGGDAIFTGVYAGFGDLFSDKMELDLYALMLLRPRYDDPVAGVEVDTMNLVTLGHRVKNRSGMLDYRLEVGLQFGSMSDAVSTLAYQGDLEVGLHVVDKVFRVGVEGFFASGDDPTTADNEGWNHLFPTAHKWLGLSDVIGPRSNVGGGVLHLSLKPIDRVSLSSQTHVFFRPESPGGAYAGTEIDIGGGYRLGNGLTLRTTYALFLPNDENFSSNDSIHFFELELRFVPQFE